MLDSVNDILRPNMFGRDLAFYTAPRADGAPHTDTWLSHLAQYSPPSPSVVVNVLRSLYQTPNGTVGIVWSDYYLENYIFAWMPRFSDAHDFDDAVSRLVHAQLVEDLGPTKRSEASRAWGSGVRGGMGAGTSTVRKRCVQVRRYRLTPIGEQVQAHWLATNPKTGEPRWRCADCSCYAPRVRFTHATLCDYCAEEASELAKQASAKGKALQ